MSMNMSYVIIVFKYRKVVSCALDVMSPTTLAHRTSRALAMAEGTEERSCDASSPDNASSPESRPSSATGGGGERAGLGGADGGASASSGTSGLAITSWSNLPLPVVALGGVVVGVFAVLKLKRLVGGGDFADAQAKYRRCNRCAKKGAKVRCTRCRRAYYCSRPCLKAAWKLEICECC